MSYEFNKQMLILRFQNIDNKVRVYRRQTGVKAWTHVGDSPLFHDDKDQFPGYEIVAVKEGEMLFQLVEVKVEICNVPFGDGRSGPNPYHAKFDVFSLGKKVGSYDRKATSDPVTAETVVDKVTFSHQL